MGVGDDRRLATRLEPSAHVTPEDDKATKEMDPAMFRALVRESGGGRAEPAMTVPATNKQLAELVAQTAPAPARRDMSTGELMATVDEAFADFGDEPAAPVAPLVDTASKPVKKQALIVADHRLDTQHARAIAPITKPPSMRDDLDVAVQLAGAQRATSVIDEPAQRGTMLVALIATLAVAIVLAIALVLLR